MTAGDPHWRFGFYAPAGFTTDPAGVERARTRLESLGHAVVVDPTVASRRQRFAADDEARLAAVRRMADAPDVDVPVAVRGGYGWTRLLDRLDYAALARARKRWLGHSDFTAFQLAALARAGMTTFAGPMAAYDFGAEVPSAFTFEQCFGVLGSATWQVDCALDGPARPRHRRYAVGRQPRHGRAPRRHAVPARGRRGHPVPRGRRRAPVPRRADALPARARRHPRPPARGAARQLHRVHALAARRRLRPRRRRRAAPRPRGGARSTPGCRSATSATSSRCRWAGAVCLEVGDGQAKLTLSHYAP